MVGLEYNQKLFDKYTTLSRKVNENFINIHPIQRGGILTPEAQKVLLDYGDGYSLCDNCLKGRLDLIENPPVDDFLEDFAKFIDMDYAMPTAAARDAKRLVVSALKIKYPDRKTVIVDSLAHYTTYLSIEINNLKVKEVPNLGEPFFEIKPESYRDKIEEVIREEGKPPLLIILTHVDYQYGNYNDPKPIGDICKEYKVPFLLNAAYTAGILPVLGKKNGIDFISCSGHKSMAASGPIGMLGGNDNYKKDIFIPSKLRGDLTNRSFSNKFCNFLGCPPVYGAPLMTLMASFPTIVKRTQKEYVDEESKKANHIIDKISKIKGITVLGKLPKIHPLTHLKTDGFNEVAKIHPRRGFFIRDEFKKHGIIGMAPGISKNMKYNTFNLTWEQIKIFVDAFLDIAQRYNLI
jgi:Sep-tRNA:Cys-tRNA synthetase